MTDGCVHLVYNSSWKNYSSSQLGISCQDNRFCTKKAGKNGPSITYKIPPAGSFSYSQPPCCASLLAFGLIGADSYSLSSKRSEGMQVEIICT